MKIRVFLVLLGILSLAGMLAGACSSGGGQDSADDDADDDAGADEWTDPDTGLIWQVKVASDYVDWEDAIAYCNGLSLAGSADWRLPTISELRTLIRGCSGSEAGGACGVTDSCLEVACQDETCYGCNYGDGPNNGCFGVPELEGGCDYYWSSSHVADAADRAWAIGFSSSFIYKPRVYYTFHARCVR